MNHVHIINSPVLLPGRRWSQLMTCDLNHWLDGNKAALLFLRPSVPFGESNCQVHSRRFAPSFLANSQQKRSMAASSSSYHNSSSDLAHSEVLEGIIIEEEVLKFVLFFIYWPDSKPKKKLLHFVRTLVLETNVIHCLHTLFRFSRPWTGSPWPPSCPSCWRPPPSSSSPPRPPV